MNDKLKKYPASAYDENLNIKISVSLWLVIVFLIRPYVVMLLSLANMSDHTQLIYLLYANDATFVLSAVAALPAVVLFIVWARRRPDSGGTIRWIWHHGRALLVTSALFNLFIVGISAFWVGRGPKLADVAQAILIMYIILYLYSSERLRDTFQDFS